MLIWGFVEDLRLKVGLFFFGIKSLVGVVSWWVDKNWCFVDSIFSWFTVCLRVLQISVVDLVIRKG